MKEHNIIFIKVYNEKNIGVNMYGVTRLRIAKSEQKLNIYYAVLRKLLLTV